MSHRYLAETLDRILLDTMDNGLPFGGKVVILGLTVGKRSPLYLEASWPGLWALPIRARRCGNASGSCFSGTTCVSSWLMVGVGVTLGGTWIGSSGSETAVNRARTMPLLTPCRPTILAFPTGCV